MFGKPNVNKLLGSMDLKGIAAALSHRDVRVRKDAVVALGKLSEVLLEPLLGALSNDSETSALRKFDDDPTLRTRARATLCEPLLSLLEDQDVFVRYDAARALRVFGDHRAIDLLISHLGDKHAPIREPAAQALGALGGPRAAEPLVSLLVRDAGYKGSQRAGEALVMLGHASIQPLTRLISSHPVPKTGGLAAVDALKKLRAVEPLITVLKEKEYGEVRGEAARALGDLGDPSAADALRAAVADEDSFVSGLAKSALAKLTS